MLLFKAVSSHGNQECDLISILLGNHNRLHHLLCPIVDDHVRSQKFFQLHLDFNRALVSMDGTTPWHTQVLNGLVTFQFCLKGETMG
jgi:hypothetical protein